jgi:hypothetical protein
MMPGRRWEEQVVEDGAKEAHVVAPDLLTQLSRTFAEHGRVVYGSRVAQNSSPLYAHLARAVADDPALLALSAEADQSTTVTNLFFAAVHYLLMADLGAPLAAYYPDLSIEPRPIADAYPIFRAYCLEHADEIRALVTTQCVQTNEVRRCSVLLPALQSVWERGGRRPLALVEVGASAGLLLNWDRYAYAYQAENATTTIGDRLSPVRLVSEARGATSPPLPATLPPVVWRVGADIHPIDAHDEREVRWLRSLVWPEHQDRMALLDAALSLTRQYPPRIVAGDAGETLPALLAQAPADATLCVYHGYTLNQMPAATRERILARIAEYGMKRDLSRVAMEWWPPNRTPTVEVFTYADGETSSELLALCESHGRWVEWLAEQ